MTEVAAGSACQDAGVEPPRPRRPWAGDPRAADKDELAEYVAAHPEGAPVIWAVRQVLDGGADASGADAALAAELFWDNPRYFKTGIRDGLRWVEPRTALFILTASKQAAGTADSGGVALTNGRRSLGRRSSVESDGERGDILGTLAAKREGTEERFLAFEDREEPGKYLLVPYRTRFNSPKRVREQLRRFDGTWKKAGERYHRGVILTLTTDPKRYDSIAEQAETFMEDVDRLRGWLSYNVNDGERPETVLAVEFTDSGLVHAHLAVFGVEYVPHSRLSAYWRNRRDRGDVVYVNGIETVHGSWRWRGDGPEGKEGRSPRAYLKKTLRDALALAECSPVEVMEAAAALREGDVDAEAHQRGRDWWKLAMYWALDLRFFTASPDLTPSKPEGPAESRWRFVGVARYGNFPAHIHSNSKLVVRDRPPP